MLSYIVDYRQTLQILSLRTAPLKSGLERMFRAASSLNHPEKKFPSIHVAGTNGKGSVCLKIAKTLEENGYRVGLFTSPHLSCFRERIRINGEMIPEEDVARLFSRIAAMELTYFECCTLLCFLYFAEQKVDVAVLEVGLGGRLDATNLINPILSVITSISKDHTEILGNSEEEIAREKAGIIKPKTPVLIGPRVPRKIIEETALQRRAPLIQVLGSFLHYGEENHAIAKRALSLLSPHFRIAKSSLNKEPICRFEEVPRDCLSKSIFSPYVETPIILDVAHNPDGITHLIKRLKITFKELPLHFLVNISAKKDVADCAKSIGRVAASIQILRSSHPRLNDPESLLPYFPNAAINSAKDALTCAFERTRQDGGIPVVCGSFFIMGPIRKLLGYEEPLDP